MRISFGGNRGMGGGGGGGGGMLGTVQRVVKAGVGGAAQDPFSHSSSTTTNNTSASAASKKTNKTTTSHTLSLSSSTVSPPKIPIPAFSTGPTLASCSSPVSSDGSDWEFVDGIEDERAYGFCDDFVFGSVPSMDEVQNAVSSLQQVIDPSSFSQFVKERYAYATDREVTDQYTSSFGSVPRVSSVGPELGALDWIEPTMQLYNPRMLQPHGLGRVHDAFHLLQTDASVQKMVVSLSSDKAVWDAVLSNDVVRELTESFDAARTNMPESPDKSSADPNAAMTLIQWIFNTTKAKIMEMIDKIITLVNEFFPPLDNRKIRGETDLFEEKLRTSFRLSIVVMLIVVVTRAHAA